jgi:hypothetical protein
MDSAPIMLLEQHMFCEQNLDLIMTNLILIIIIQTEATVLPCTFFSELTEFSAS